MIVFLDPLARWAFIVGAGLGAGAGVQLGRWSLLLLMRWSWKRQQLRQLADARRGREVPRVHPRVQVEHAGQYVQQLRAEGRRACYGQQDLPDAWDASALRLG